MQLESVAHSEEEEDEEEIPISLRSTHKKSQIL